jgi:hypothetical protein
MWGAALAREAGDGFRQKIDSFWRNKEARLLAVRLVADQPSLDQYLQMLRNSGLRETNFADDLLAVAGGVGGQMPQDFDTRGMRKRTQHFGKPCV